MICLICKKEFRDITNTHLKSHGLTRSEYAKIDKEFDTFLKERMSKIAKGKTDIKKGKTYEEVFGKEKSSEWKRKIGVKGEGRKFVRTEGWRIKQRQSHLGHKKKGGYSFGKGKDHPNWNNGSSFLPYTTDWTYTLKKSIRERDHYTCQICGEEPAIVVHHIDYDKKNCNPDNLITLCRSCHTKTNHNRKYWTNYLLLKD